MSNQTRRTWAEINLSNLAFNYQAIGQLLPEDCKILGVVKANAYGHGALPVAQKLKELGAQYLAVACLDEGMELRNGGITGPILVLGVTPIWDGQLLLDYDLTQTVCDSESGRALAALAADQGKTLKVHLKADTGMSRLGFLCDPDYVGQTLDEMTALCQLDGLDVEGVYTHFAVSDTDEEYTMVQFDRFLTVVDGLKDRGISIKIRHCANSGAVLNYPCTYLDMVRPGILLYGHYPEKGMEDLCPLRPVMELKTRVSMVRTLPAGTAVSYGCTRTLERESVIAVLPIGYADGLARRFSNELQVLVHGQFAPIVGRVCMDMCMVDVTDIPAVTCGDEVVIFGQSGDEIQSVDRGAEMLDTISYEVLCDVGPRVPRVYL